MDATINKTQKTSTDILDKLRKNLPNTANGEGGAGIDGYAHPLNAPKASRGTKRFEVNLDGGLENIFLSGDIFMIGEAVQVLPSRHQLVSTRIAAIAWSADEGFRKELMAQGMGIWTNVQGIDSSGEYRILPYGALQKVSRRDFVRLEPKDRFMQTRGKGIVALTGTDAGLLASCAMPGELLRMAYTDYDENDL